MNWKKIAVIGVLALVVIGCVLAAGCTQVNTDPNQVNPASGYNVDNVVTSVLTQDKYIVMIHI